jgi:hypothetical protein
MKSLTTGIQEFRAPTGPFYNACRDRVRAPRPIHGEREFGNKNAKQTHKFGNYFDSLLLPLLLDASFRLNDPKPH